MLKDSKLKDLFNSIEQNPEIVGRILNIYDAQWIDKNYGDGSPQDLKKLYKGFYEGYYDDVIEEFNKIYPDVDIKTMIANHMMAINKVRGVVIPPTPKGGKPKQNIVAEKYPTYNDEQLPIAAEEQSQMSPWIGIKSARKPQIGEKTMLCGYLFRGVEEYIVGIYEGDDEWTTAYDDVMGPEFKVLYWMPIPKIANIEQDMI